MRYRTIGLAAAVLLAAPLMTSCRNPAPPPGGGGDGPPLIDCGTIDTTAPVTAAEAQSITCWQGTPQERDYFGGYHTGHGTHRYKIVQIDGNVTSTFETVGTGHQVKVTTVTAGGTTTTKTCTDEQFTHSQFVFDRATGELKAAVC
jgi:hypothetical protein